MTDDQCTCRRVTDDGITDMTVCPTHDRKADRPDHDRQRRTPGRDRQIREPRRDR